MKQKKLLIKVCAVALVLTSILAMTAIVYGTNNSSDPLVTLSYLTGTYKSNLLSEVNTAVAAKQKQLSSEFSSQINALEDGLSSEASAPVENAYKEVNLSSGQSVSVSAGGEILFLSGSAAAETAGLTDTTSGSNLAAGGALAANHLYVATGDCEVRATDSAKLLVK